MHVEDGKCQGEILRVPFARLKGAFDSGQHNELERFVNRDSDGLGNPLPREVSVNLGLAVVYSTDFIPEYNGDVLVARDKNARARRARAQRTRRAARRLGVPPVGFRSESKRLAPYKNSTIHLVSGALLVHHSTGSWHYREQTEMLSIMGLFRNGDFIRYRVDYLSRSNPTMFERIEAWALEVKNVRLLGMKPDSSRFPSLNFSR
jgi:hypothetical protein